MSRPHFLEALGASTEIVGYGKPYRGIILSSHAPETGTRFVGFLKAESVATPISTSGVVSVQEVSDSLLGEPAIYLIETRNSVYVVRVTPND